MSISNMAEEKAVDSYNQTFTRKIMLPPAKSNCVMPDGSLVRIAGDHRHAPRPHQQMALNDVLAELKRADRATLVMACGTGKTLVGMLAAAEITKGQGGIVAALFPSLALISQTVPEWLRHWPRDVDFRYMVVCSDPTVADNDEITPDPATLPFGVTTDQDQVETFLHTEQKGQTLVVFVTYQSATIVGQALNAAGKKADFTIFDEAHRTAGAKDSTFGVALHDQHFPVQKRLFMTATPRITKRLERDKDGNAPVVSMDDTSIYGRVVHRYMFKQAVSDGIICGYKVVVSHASRIEFQSNEPAYETAGVVALSKALIRTGARKVISYHQSINAAKQFAEMAKALMPSVDVLHINGGQTARSRAGIMNQFKLSSKSLVTNAKCLTEGVDVPAIDMVVFMAKTKSTIDVVQAVGRALRKNGKKEYGYVLVPLLMDVESRETVEDAVKRQKLTELWQTLSSLADEDADLSQAIDSAAAKRRTGSSVDFGPWVEVISDTIDPVSLQNAIGVEIVRQLGGPKVTTFLDKVELLKKHAAENGGKIPYSVYSVDGVVLRDWMSLVRTDYRSGRLKQDKVLKLESIPGWEWNKGKFIQTWYTNLKTLRNQTRFLSESNSISLNRHLKDWLRRVIQRRDELTPDQVFEIESIPGFRWDEKILSHWTLPLDLEEEAEALKWTLAQVTSGDYGSYTIEYNRNTSRWVASIWEFPVMREEAECPTEAIENLRQKLPGYITDIIRNGNKCPQSAKEAWRNKKDAAGNGHFEPSEPHQVVISGAPAEKLRVRVKAVTQPLYPNLETLVSSDRTTQDDW